MNIFEYFMVIITSELPETLKRYTEFLH